MGFGTSKLENFFSELVYLNPNYNWPIIKTDIDDEEERALTFAFDFIAANKDNHRIFLQYHTSDDFDSDNAIIQLDDHLFEHRFLDFYELVTP